MARSPGGAVAVRQRRSIRPTIAAIRTKPIDFTILVVTLILVAFGIVMVFSASFYMAQQSELYNNDGYYFFTKQVVGAGLGLLAMIVLMFFNYKKLEKLRTLAVFVTLALLVVVFIPAIGKDVNGSSRWIDFGFFQFQPGEAAKFTMILFTASFISRRRDQMQTFKKGVMPVLLMLVVFCGLIILQPNLSMVISLTFMTMIMLVAGNVRKLHIALVAAAAVGVVVLLIFIAPYRLARYQIFMDPWKDPQVNGYQLIQSLYALASGGIFGRGLGRSMQKNLFLPYGESDFIFSIIVEEIGFLGAIVLIGLFFFLIWRGIRVALSCPDIFGSMMAAGITAIIAIQVMINIAVVTCSIPPTGVPLPFVSAGLSQLVIFMAEIGILLNISRTCPKK